MANSAEALSRSKLWDWAASKTFESSGQRHWPLVGSGDCAEMPARIESELDEVDQSSKQTTTTQAPHLMSENTSVAQNEGEADPQSKRRASNRDSARRTRKRRLQEYQSICDEATELRNETIRLQQQVADLTETNNALIKCVPELANKCKDLVAENTQLLASNKKLRRSLRYLQSPGLGVINLMSKPCSLPLITTPSCSVGTPQIGAAPRLPIAAGPASNSCALSKKQIADAQQVTILLQTLQELQQYRMANGGPPSPQTPQDLPPRCFSPNDSSLDSVTEGSMQRQPSMLGYGFGRPEYSEHMERMWDAESYSDVSTPRTQVSPPIFQY